MWLLEYDTRPVVYSVGILGCSIITSVTQLSKLAMTTLTTSPSITRTAVYCTLNVVYVRQ